MKKLFILLIMMAFLLPVLAEPVVAAKASSLHPVEIQPLGGFCSIFSFLCP